jgi:hypothetical protein
MSRFGTPGRGTGRRRSVRERLRPALSAPGLLLAVAGSCGSPDLEADRAELLRLHDLARTAHLEKRADLLVASFADSFLELNHGLLSRPPREESRRGMQAYFDRSTFQEWDDLAPPIVRISPDGRMAYVIVQKSVRLTRPDSLGVPQPDHTVFVWLEVYEKQAGAWKLTAVASTDRPGAPGDTAATRVGMVQGRVGEEGGT